LDTTSYLESVGKDLDAVISLYWVTPDGTKLALAAAYNTNPALQALSVNSHHRTYIRGQPIVGRVWETGTSILIPVFNYKWMEEIAKPDALEYLEASKMHSMIVVPVNQARAVLGVIAAYRIVGQAGFSEEHLPRLEAWAARFPSPAQKALRPPQDAQ
jgi:hypothetical protein